MTADDAGAATELGCGALSPSSEGESSERTACWSRSVPSAEVCRGPAGAANTEAATGSLAHVFSGKAAQLLPTIVSSSHKRPAEILGTRFPSRDLFRLLGPARTVVRFFMSLFALLRLIVGRVGALLIRILPHGLSDALV